MNVIINFLKRNKRIIAALLLAIALDRKYSIREKFAEQKRRHALFKKLPGPPIGSGNEHPIFGNFVSKEGLFRPSEGFDPELVSEKLLDRLQDLQNRYKNDTDLVRVFALNSLVPTNVAGFVMVYGIEVAREILSHKGMQDWFKGHSYDVSSVLIGDSVLRSHGEMWQKQRAVMERGMTHNIMESALPRVLKTANELVDKFEQIARSSHNQAEVDMSEESLKFTLDVIGRAAFSHDFKSVTAQTTADAPLYYPFQTILKTLDHRCHFIHEHLLSFLPTKRNRTFNSALATVKSQCSKILKARKESKGDVLDILLEHRDTEKGLPTSLIMDNIHTALFAGHDTTGAALTWMLRLLASHPHYMKRCRDEILAKFGPNGDPTYQDLEELEFLNAIVLETLRLYPSAAFTRGSDHDVMLGNGKYYLPAGTEVLIVPYLIHRDERYWDRPNEFVPERFLFEELDKNSSEKRGNSLQSRIGRISSKKAYLPFSLGPRNCVGRPLALMEMRVVMVKLLQKFVFEPSKEHGDFNSVPLFQLTLNPSRVRLIPVLASS